jgi:hypothetical protein
MLGLTRVAGAPLAAAIACGGASSPFGGVTSEPFLGAPGGNGAIFGAPAGIVLGGAGLGGTSSWVCTGGRAGSGGSSGGASGTGSLVGDDCAGRGGAAS